MIPAQKSSQRETAPANAKSRHFRNGQKKFLQYVDQIPLFAPTTPFSYGIIPVKIFRVKGKNPANYELF
jgi:hypothetical protein